MQTFSVKTHTQPARAAGYTLPRCRRPCLMWSQTRGIWRVFAFNFNSLRKKKSEKASLKKKGKEGRRENTLLLRSARSIYKKCCTTRWCISLLSKKLFFPHLKKTSGMKTQTRRRKKTALGVAQKPRARRLRFQIIWVWLRLAGFSLSPPQMSPPFPTPPPNTH